MSPEPLVWAAQHGSLPQAAAQPQGAEYCAVSRTRPFALCDCVQFNCLATSVLTSLLLSFRQHRHLLLLPAPARAPHAPGPALRMFMPARSTSSTSSSWDATTGALRTQQSGAGAAGGRASTRQRHVGLPASLRACAPALPLAHSGACHARPGAAQPPAERGRREKHAAKHAAQPTRQGRSQGLGAPLPPAAHANQHPGSRGPWAPAPAGALTPLPRLQRAHARGREEGSTRAPRAPFVCAPPAPCYPS